MPSRSFAFLKLSIFSCYRNRDKYRLVKKAKERDGEAQQLTEVASRIGSAEVVADRGGVRGDERLKRGEQHVAHRRVWVRRHRVGGELPERVGELHEGARAELAARRTPAERRVHVDQRRARRLRHLSPRAREAPNRSAAARAGSDRPVVRALEATPRARRRRTGARARRTARRQPVAANPYPLRDGPVSEVPAALA